MADRIGQRLGNYRLTRLLKSKIPVADRGLVRREKPHLSETENGSPTQFSREDSESKNQHTRFLSPEGVYDGYCSTNCHTTGAR